MQQHLPGRCYRACDRGQQRHRIMAGARSEADVQDRPDGQRRKQDALQQAERAGQFMKDELCRKGRRQHQRHGVEAECIQRDGACLGHASLRTTVSAYRSRGADRSRRTRSERPQTARAASGRGPRQATSITMAVARNNAVNSIGRSRKRVTCQSMINSPAGPAKIGLLAAKSTTHISERLPHECDCHAVSLYSMVVLPPGAIPWLLKPPVPPRVISPGTKSSMCRC